MGNSESQQTPKPTYSKAGVLFGQVCQYGNYTKECPKKIVEKVQSSNLSGKRYLITGASSGIGMELCKVLLVQGASLIMVSRSISNLEKAKQQVIDFAAAQLEKNPEDLTTDIQLKTLDVSQIQQVIDFCKQMQNEKIVLDGIVNNAGALPTKQIMKKYQDQEIEDTITTHVINPILLSIHLQPLLEKQNGIILNNTSAGAYSQKLDTRLIQRNFVDCIDTKKENPDKLYADGALVYAQCKRAMIEATTELTKYLKYSKNSNVKAISIHPGWAKTPGLETLYETQPQYKNYKFREPIESAYGLAVSLSHAYEMENGQFYFDGKKQDFHKALAGTAVQQEERDLLWKYIMGFNPNM